MKHIIILVFTTISISAFCQEYNIQEPDYLGNIEYISDTNSTIKLERQKCTIKAKANAASYLPGANLVAGKTKGMNTVKGLSSNIRINSGNEMKFIVKVADNRIDPFELINIFKLEQNQNKKSRFLETSNASFIGGVSSMDIDYINFKAEKHGESSFIIEITDNLSKGEYAITIDGSRDVFNMFGVD